MPSHMKVPFVLSKNWKKNVKALEEREKIIRSENADILPYATIEIRVPLYFEKKSDVDTFKNFSDCYPFRVVCLEDPNL